MIECIARGVIEKDGKILLCHGKGRENWYFPGGHIEDDEPASLALAREIDEELGAKTTVGAFLLASENHFTMGGQPVHEINLVFEATIEGAETPVSREDHIEFAWFPRDEVQNLLIYPLSVRDALFKENRRTWVSEGFA